MGEAGGITFDEEFRIRLMDPDKQQQSESLRDNSKVFIEKVQRLGDIVSGYVHQLEAQRAKIDAEKLRAVGLRNKVSALEEERKRKRLDLLEQVGDRKAELERLQRELDQLVKVKLNQEALIAKLSSAQEEL